MPRFDPAQAGAGPLVRGFTAAGQFVVDAETYASVLLTPERVMAWEPPALATLGADDLRDLLALDPAPEFLLLGTGAKLARPPAAFVRSLKERGIGVESMDSRAAARTWAVLRAEHRWIVAALLPL